jgi:Tfp pilus assembly protein PilN
MIEINLIPDVKQQLISAQRMRATVISISIVIGIVAIAVVVLLASYVYGVQTVRGGILDGDITKKATELTSVPDLSKTLTLQNQLTLISKVHDEKKITSRLYDVLAKIIPGKPNDIQISTLTVDTENQQINIEGQAANSYAAVEVFKKTIDAARVTYKVDSTDTTINLASNVTTGSTSYGEDASGLKVLRFSLGFTYAKELFMPSSKDVRITIANQGNATDSYLGVPESVFVDRAKDIQGGTN